MQHFKIHEHSDGFSLHSGNRPIAEGLTYQEATDVAGHLEEEIFRTNGDHKGRLRTAAYFPPTLMAKAVEANRAFMAMNG